MEDIKQHNFTTPVLFNIYNNPDWTSEITTFTTHTFNPQSIIQSSDNLMYLKITLPRSELVLRPLKARYSSEEESSCPHDIDEDDKVGSIDLPGLDPTFNGSFFCGIKIKLNEEETIVFNISNFLVTGNVSPVLGPLVFRDNYLNTYYRSNLTDFVHAQSHRTGSISIVQTKTNRIQRLKMSYKKYKCGGVVRATDGLQIKYPQVNAGDIGGDIMCVWSVEKPFYSPFNQDSGREFKLLGNFSFTESCENEYLEIVEGQRTNQSSALKICKNKMTDNFEYIIRKSTTYIIYRSVHYNAERSAFSLSIDQRMTYSSETSVNVNTPPIKIDKEFYKNNMECSWIFYTKPGLYLQVKFLGRFFIEDSLNCSKDYLEIQRDHGGLWIPEARFCGRQVPALFNSTSNRIQIIFRTDETVTTEGFEFAVQTHCTRIVNVTSTEIQTIESPPNNSRAIRKMHCEYIFQGSATDKLIIVKTKFDVNTLTYVRDACRLGSLTVHKRDEEGKDLKGVLHCELQFEERAMQYLRFVYEAYTGQKFTMEYAYDSCGGNLTKPAVIRHLKHEEENSYAENMNCVWYITATPEHSIAVKFKYFATEETYDQLTIYSGHVENQDKLVARLSGKYTSLIPIVVDSNRAIVKAFSDSSGSDKGFEANILFLANCNERISLTEGNSPLTLVRNIRFNSSEQYICNYRISAPKSYRVRGEIKKLQINGANSTCQNAKTNCEGNCNTLKIFNNPSNDENDAARFCASASINKTFVSFYETILLRLDASLPGQYSYEIILKMEKTECGFTEYKLRDNEKILLDFPFDNSTRYAPNTHCTWRFIAEHGLDFHFRFIDLQNKSQVTGKCMDYITIKNAYSVYDLCGRSQNFSITGLSDSHQDYAVTFHSDESEEGKGFRLFIDQSHDCNLTHRLLSKTLSYQSYGDETSLCNATILVPENYTLNFYIHLMYFHDHECENLHFKIFDLKTNKTLMDRCENAYGNVNLFTTTNAVRIETSRFSRIMLDYSASQRNLTPGCGGTFRSHKAQFSSPPYENDRNFSECRWDIIAPTTSIKTFQFYDFNMGTITNCHLDNVKIIEILPNQTEKLLKTYCGPDLPRAFSSTSDHLVIVSKKSPNFDGTGWTINYYSSNYERESKLFINYNQDW